MLLLQLYIYIFTDGYETKKKSTYWFKLLFK